MFASKTSQLSDRLEEGNQINLSFHYHNKQIIGFINSLLSKILSRNNQLFLQSTVITILRELIVNAVKANTKRLYFGMNDLDINNHDQYTQGMEGFKSFMIKNQELCEKELRKSLYRIKFSISKNDKGLIMYIKNNVAISTEEMKRINERMTKAKEVNDFSEIYGEMIDDTEGEGLGILLTLLFLRNSGIGEDSLKIIPKEKYTISSLFVPSELRPKEITNKIQENILEEVNDLPTFPENLAELQRMCKDPDSTIRQIARKIVFDPSLTTEILKLANSAGFFTRQRTENVEEAIKKIGMKNLNAILTASSARKIMEERYSSFKQIWNHCARVAGYSRLIGLKYKLYKIIDSVFLAGLLHDLGKIVLLSTNTRFTEWISDIVKNREIRTSTVIEEVSIGISHSKIGDLIATKWNLPEYVIQAIRNHHSPLNATDENRDIIFTVYLANQICGIEDRKYFFDYIESTILERFDLKDETKFHLFHEEMKEKLDKEIE